MGCFFFFLGGRYVLEMLRICFVSGVVLFMLVSVLFMYFGSFLGVGYSLILIFFVMIVGGMLLISIMLLILSWCF